MSFKDSLENKKWELLEDDDMWDDQKDSWDGDDEEWKDDDDDWSDLEDFDDE
ncbi:MAG: hypothetical protein ACRC0X_01000 [Brevinema sp.]